MKKKDKDPNDNTVTRLIAIFVVLLMIVAALAVIAGVSFWTTTGRALSGTEHSDYSIGAGLCFLAAVAAVGMGLLGVGRLIAD